MPIEQDRTKYFYLEANNTVTESEPEPATFDGSRVKPLIDLDEYVKELIKALAKVGIDDDKAKNKGDFIFIQNWFLGLVAGKLDFDLEEFNYINFLSTPDPGVADKTDWSFNLNPTNEATEDSLLINVLREKARRGVDVRVLGWVSFGVYARYFQIFPFNWIPVVGRLFDPFISQKAQAGLSTFGQYNLTTMNSIKELRIKKDGAEISAVLNTIGHTAGAVHTKFAMVGTKNNDDGISEAIAFTGGIDFANSRWATFGHRIIDLPEKWNKGIPKWHDVQAAVEGKAAQATYDWFRDMWNENLRRDAHNFRFEGEELHSYIDGTKEIEERNVLLPLISTPDSLTHHVQSLRTIPRHNYSWHNCLPEGKPASFAKKGLFEIRAAWRKAILAAEEYIYIEDQAMQSKEVMEWINESVRAHPNLKVILATSGSPDTLDPTGDMSQQMSNAFNDGLLGAGEDPDRVLSTGQQNRIRVFKLWQDSAAPSEIVPLLRPSWDGKLSVTSIVHNGDGTLLVTTGTRYRKDSPKMYEDEDIWMIDKWDKWPNPTYKVRVIHQNATTAGQFVEFLVEPVEGVMKEGTQQLIEIPGVLVHAKLTLIDDKWALIGSANVMRRSLYTDWEHSVSFLDENENGNVVRELRKRLWAEHSLVGVVEDLQEALGVWEPAWNPVGNSEPRPIRRLRTLSLPVPAVDMTSATREKNDWAEDVDSRAAWGGIKPPESLR